MSSSGNVQRLKAAIRNGAVRPRTSRVGLRRFCHFQGTNHLLPNVESFSGQRVRVPRWFLSTQANNPTAEADGGGDDGDFHISDSTVGTMDRKTIRSHRFKILELCKQQTYQGARAAQSLLDALVDESLLVGAPTVNLAIHNSCLDAWAKCGSRAGFKKTCELLNTMQQRCERNPKCAPAPNTISYNIALNACARSAAMRQNASEKAEELIQTMEQLSVNEPDGVVHPDTQSYNLVILAHANQAPYKYGAATAAEDWLQYLSKRNTEGGPGPDSISFNTVLKAWKVSPEEKGADRALELLNLMIKLYNEGHEEVCPGEFSFCTVIDAFAKRQRPKEAEDILKMALSFFLDPDFVQLLRQKNTRIDLRPCFNAAINGWAKSMDGMAPERADSLLHDMVSIAKETDVLVTEPDVFTFTSTVSAMARSGRQDAPEIVESRLYGMLEQYEKRNGRAPLPNRATFDCAIRTWFRSSKNNKAERMESLLNTMTDLALKRRSTKDLPEPRTVNMCILTWCRSGKAATKALDLLNKMEVANCVDTSSYVHLILALVDHGKKNKDQRSIYSAAAVLEKLQLQIRKRPDFKWTRDAEALYNRVISALVIIGDARAADQALRILHGMEKNATTKSLPSQVTYSIVIAALAKRPSPDRTRAVLSIFDRMLQLHKDPKSKLRLDTRSFHSILTYLSNTRQRWGADRAYEVLRIFQEMYVDITETQGDNKRLMPSSLCYDRCVEAMASCGDKDSVTRAVEILREFIDDFRHAKTHGIPSATGFNTVHKYCISLGSEEGLTLAQEVQGMMDNLSKDGHLQS